MLRTCETTDQHRAIEELDVEDPTPPMYSPSHPIVHRELQRFIRVQIQKRWDYVHTSAMGVAFYMDPSMSLDDFVGNDFNTAQSQVLDIGKSCGVVGTNARAALTAELFKFAAMKRGRNFVETHSLTSPRDFWVNQHSNYPLLSKIVTIVFAIPPSSAASERAWSIFDHIHTKKRNRLSSKKVALLVYIYINQGVINKGELDMALHISRPGSVLEM
jgi:hypothetical protein